MKSTQAVLHSFCDHDLCKPCKSLEGLAERRSKRKASAEDAVSAESLWPPPLPARMLFSALQQQHGKSMDLSYFVMCCIMEMTLSCTWERGLIRPLESGDFSRVNYGLVLGSSFEFRSCLKPSGRRRGRRLGAPSPR